jgi:hypothetical protein
LQPFFGIQQQDLDGRASDGRFPNDYGCATLEMLLPRLEARIKERRESPRFGVITSHIAPFVQIAVDTSQREVVEIIVSAVFSRPNVFDVQGSQRRLILIQSTILAAAISSPANMLSRGEIHSS